MVINVPTGPDDGLNEDMVGACAIAFKLIRKHKKSKSLKRIVINVLFHKYSFFNGFEKIFD